MFGLLVFGVYMLPAIQVFEMPNSLIYDRYLSIPIIGLFLILLGILNKITVAWRKNIAFTMGFLIVIMSFWSVITTRYVSTYKNMVVSTEHLNKLYPNWLNARFNLAISLIGAGQLDRAEKIINEDAGFANWVKNYLKGRILQDRGDIKGAYHLFYSVSVITHKHGIFHFADSHIAEILMDDKEYRKVNAIIDGILNHPVKDPIILYQMTQMAKEPELIKARNSN